MPLTLALPVAWAGFLFVIWVAERHDDRTRRARLDLASHRRMDSLDRAAAHLTSCDPWQELDIAWCAEKNIDWTRNAPGSTPMRPFDPAPHTYPRRPARHGSHNRLHRGF